jgi:pimeloyl-ACP methyl ester carboxylesterase
MQIQVPTRTEAREQAGYFTVPGAHLYSVLHQVTNPVARVLLAGPFASERQFSYNPWVRWARYLAARQVEVLRYDYRGVGESTGVFTETTFEHWHEDIDLLADWIAGRSPDIPLLLHGVEMGAILAAKCFQRGIGDALLLWAPPADANQSLRAILRRWAGMEQLFESPDNRKSAVEYIRDLEQGNSIEVHGYEWSSRLWQESSNFHLPAGLTEQMSLFSSGERPIKIVTFGKDAKSMVMPYRRYEEGQDLTGLYSSTFDWITDAVARKTGEPHAGSN